MLDQAEKLRQMMRDGVASRALRDDLSVTEERVEEESVIKPGKVIAITSGKGGVGKTNLSVNLALALIEHGARVALMDADLGLANVDVLLGILPVYTLKDAMDGEVSIQEILCEGPGGLRIIPGGSGVQELADLSEEKIDGFIASLREIEDQFDYILIDTGAGISRTVMSFLYAADEILLVTTPEPTSITDAYAVAKTVFTRMPDARLGLVVNRATDYGEAQETFRKMNTVLKSFLGTETVFKGWVVDDPIVARSVRAHKPVLLFAPDTSVVRLFRQLAKNLHRPSEAETTTDVSVARNTQGIAGFFTKLKNLFKRDKGGV